MEKTVKSGAALAAPRTLLTWLLVLIILLGVVTPALAADIQQIDLPAIFASGEKGTCTFVPPFFRENEDYEGFVQESYDVYFLNVTGDYQRLQVLDTGSAYPDYSASIEMLESIATVDHAETDDAYKAMVANYAQAKTCITLNTGIVMTDADKADHLLAFICITDDDDELHYGYLLIEWEKATGKVDKSKLEAALKKVPTTGYYKDDDRFNGKTVSEKGFWNEMQAVVKAAQDVYVDENAGTDEVDKATKSLDTTDKDSALSKAIADLIPTSQVNPTGLYETLNLYSEEDAKDYSLDSWTGVCRQTR